jgi:hypothetical protein
LRRHEQVECEAAAEHVVTLEQFQHKTGLGPESLSNKLNKYS